MSKELERKKLQVRARNKKKLKINKLVIPKISFKIQITDPVGSDYMISLFCEKLNFVLKKCTNPFSQMRSFS